MIFGENMLLTWLKFFIMHLVVEFAWLIRFHIIVSSVMFEKKLAVNKILNRSCETMEGAINGIFKYTINMLFVVFVLFFFFVYLFSFLFLSLSLISTTPCRIHLLLFLFLCSHWHLSWLHTTLLMSFVLEQYREKLMSSEALKDLFLILNYFHLCLF